MEINMFSCWRRLFAVVAFYRADKRRGVAGMVREPMGGV